MSTDRCQHGNVTSDSMGVYRCYLCEPVTETDLEELAAGVGDGIGEAIAKQLARRDRRIAQLELVVAQLAARSGITFTPPEIGE